METQKTENIVRQWYECIGRQDLNGILNGLAEDIHFILPKNQYNSIIPYLGTKVGRDEVVKAFQIRAEVIDVLEYKLLQLVAQDRDAFAVVYTKGKHRGSGQVFEIEDVHHIQVNDDGKIALWKAYFDPNTEVDAFKADLDERFIQAIQDQDISAVQELLSVGANPNTREPASGLTALMLASGQGNVRLVQILLDGGADVFMVDSKAGGSALHKACQGGNVDVVRMLLDAGANVDWIAPTTGHTPLMDALWFKFPDIVGCLLDRGAGLNLSTHYGFSLLEHFEYELNVNVIGKDRLIEAGEKLKARQQSDQEKIQQQQLMDAVTKGDLETVKRLIEEGADIEARYPILNGFNDAHTPLLVAARDGHTEIVAELLKAGADVNAVEPTFMAVPLHKAVYNGHVEITQMLADQPGINLDFQGATNGYTSLHDSLWHGYADCARILINAGARLDLRGHDGKIPLDIARETLGPDHEVTQLILSKSKK